MQLSRGYANQKCGIICVNSGCFIRKPVFEKVVYVQIAWEDPGISGTHAGFLPGIKTPGHTCGHIGMLTSTGLCWPVQQLKLDHLKEEKYVMITTHH